jgi:glycolate oxidase
MSHPSHDLHLQPNSRTLSAKLVADFAAIVGVANCITERAQLATYECDGLASLRVMPSIVLLPATTDEVVRVMRLAYAEGIPVVPRGSGTGLSGGATPVPGCLVLGLSRMKRILDVDLDNQWLRAEAGVINLEITQRIGPHGYYYAPDPSSQQVCSIGGNVAENSGGAHCLKYGFTTHHVLGVKVVLADGAVVDLGGPVLDPPGYDLRGAIVGSEGTLGVVTEVVVRILRKPESTRTAFATFRSVEDAGSAVSLIVAAGIVPAAIEMMDRLALEAIRAATGIDWPDVAAALLMDVDGPEADVTQTFERTHALCHQANALSVVTPKSEQERARMWRGRKSAFAAVGRLSPSYLVQDGVIPRSEIGRVLRQISEIGGRAGLRIANVFHAGDGNLHPLVLFDANVPGETERAERCSAEIMKLCIDAGGSITGEHGVGADKAMYMGAMFNETDLESMQWLRCAFDPLVRMNPGKVFPTPHLCGDRPGKYIAHATELAGLADRG